MPILHDDNDKIQTCTACACDRPAKDVGSRAPQHLAAPQTAESSACGAAVIAQSRRVAWFFLGVAILGEITGAVSLRFSEGFTRLLPTVVALASFALALYLVSRVMRTLPVSVAYPVWAGVGTAGVALVGVLALGEPLGMLKGLGIALVIGGVVILNAISKKKGGC